MHNFCTILFILNLKAAQESYKFEWEIQIHCNDLNSLAASLQEKMLASTFKMHTQSI